MIHSGFPTSSLQRFQAQPPPKTGHRLGYPTQWPRLQSPPLPPACFLGTRLPLKKYGTLGVQHVHHLAG